MHEPTKKLISPFAIIIATICLSLIGWALLPLLPVSLKPSPTTQALTVSFYMNGATSQVVESSATSKLEGALARMTGVEYISSHTNNGYGQVYVGLSKKTDLDIARFEASSIIRQIWSELPDGVSYPTVSLNEPLGNSSKSFMVYTINADLPAYEIKRITNDAIKTSFSDIRGISDIEITGAEPLEWRMVYDTYKLNELGISVRQIQEAVRSNQEKLTIGEATLSTDAETEGLNLNDIYVMTRDSTYITLNKLVTVEHKEAAPYSYYRINGRNLIYLKFSAAEGANQIVLSKQIKEKIKELKKDFSSNCQLHLAYDDTEEIENELNNIYLRSGITVILLLILVFITSLSLKYVLTVTLGIVFNLSIALLFYYWLNVEIQTYSLAAITISLNMIIDNVIVVIEHWNREKNVQVIIPILAATLTTIGALSVIFFFDPVTQQNLWFFVVVLATNLLVSVAIAMVVVPAILNFVSVENRHNRAITNARYRVRVKLRNAYGKYILFAIRKRWWFVAAIIMIFGFPVFMIPKSLEGDGTIANWYNSTIGSEEYQEEIKPIVDVALGGVLRLFVEKVSTYGYLNYDDEVVLSIEANMPYGTTLETMDNRVRKMEAFLSQYKEIKQFDTHINGPRTANIEIRFKREHEHTGFPYMLKSAIVSQAIQLGGGSWSVYGLRDPGFSNDVRDSSGSYRLKLKGYNYADLLVLADSVSNKLKEHIRINNVEVKAAYSWYKDDYSEYVLAPDKESMAKNGISLDELYYAMSPLFVKDYACGTVWSGKAMEQIKLSSRQAMEYDIWNLENMLIWFNDKPFRIKELCHIEKRQTPQAIKKENQQYVLCLQYEYNGSAKGGKKYHKKVINEYTHKMPQGYEIIDDMSNGSREEETENFIWLVLFVIVVILFITSILFNSLRYSFVVLSLLPISFIGAFLTYYALDVQFDIGGVAAMILLCGITINSAIYIVNEYKRQLTKKRNASQLRNYLRAYNAKIVAIMLTIVSTTLGFVPFIIGTIHESFWYPLAMGIIGGLVFSVIGLILFLPIFCISPKGGNCSRWG